MEEFWTEKQKANIAFYNENKDTLLANPLYKLKFVIIYEQKIEGFFDTFNTALSEAAMRFPPGEYIIQQIISEKETVDFLYPAMALT